MANQRRAGKRLIGAQLEPSFIEAVDRVSAALPRPEDRSTFLKKALADACRAAGENIPDEWVYDTPLQRKARRAPVRYKIRAGAPELNEGKG